MTDDLPSIRDAISELAEARGIEEADALRWIAGAAESATLAARRERDLKPHRVAHDIVQTEEVVDSWEVVTDEHADDEIGADGTRWRNVPKASVERRNQRDDCPDCGRKLVSANDADLPRGLSHVLVCPRLHGYAVSGEGLTDDDIVACGIGA